MFFFICSSPFLNFGIICLNDFVWITFSIWFPWMIFQQFDQILFKSFSFSLQFSLSQRISLLSNKKFNEKWYFRIVSIIFSGFDKQKPSILNNSQKGYSIIETIYCLEKSAEILMIFNRYLELIDHFQHSINLLLLFSFY